MFLFEIHFYIIIFIIIIIHPDFQCGHRLFTNSTNSWNVKTNTLDTLNILYYSYQEFRGAEFVELHGLDPWNMDSHFPVDPRTLDACQDAEVSG